MNDIYFARTGKLAARKVAGEVVILRADDSSLFVLNPVGSAVWDGANGRTALGTVVRDVICREFDIDAATAMQDASEFVAALVAEGILRTSDQPIAPSSSAPPEGTTA